MQGKLLPTIKKAGNGAASWTFAGLEKQGRNGRQWNGQHKALGKGPIMAQAPSPFCFQIIPGGGCKEMLAG